MANSIIVVIKLFLLLATQVHSLENGLARTPPMGWISWERFTCETDCRVNPDECINQELYYTMANRLDSDGYKSVGYDKINIDDCWSEKQRFNNELIADHERFPAGIEVLAKSIHQKGLKLGIYGDCGTATCANYPAQLKSESNYQDNYFDTDARTFAEWGIDSFKFDGCNIDPFKAESICPKMAKALNQTNRPILLSCEWPFYMLRNNRSHIPDFQLAKDSCNLWRYHEDIEDSWLSVTSTIDFTISLQNEIVKHHGPGGWFDPDMLVIGNFGLSLEQAKAQMAIWSIWSAPLYMSNDLRSIEREMVQILQNRKVIAVDQDELGVFGMMVAEYDDKSIQAFVKPVTPIVNGCPSFAIVYLNRRTLGNEVRVSFKLRDLLHKSPIGLALKRFTEYHKLANDTTDLCRRRIFKAATRVPVKIELEGGKKRELKLDETELTYRIDDLFEASNYAPISINSTLSLPVPLTGIRMVKLVEIQNKA